MKCRVSGWVELIQLLGIGSLLTPPLCFAVQNIGEVSRSDGGVENRGKRSVLGSNHSPTVSRSITEYSM